MGRKRRAPGRSAEARDDLGGVEAAHLDELGPAGLAGDEGDVAPRTAQPFREESRELQIGRTLDGRRGHAYAERASELARELGARGTGLDADAEAGTAGHRVERYIADVTPRGV